MVHYCNYIEQEYGKHIFITLQEGKINVSLTCSLSFWMQVSEQITQMDSDDYCRGMRMRRGTNINIKEEKFAMRFPFASNAFYSLTCNQNMSN